VRPEGQPDRVAAALAGDGALAPGGSMAAQPLGQLTFRPAEPRRQRLRRKADFHRVARRVAGKIHGAGLVSAGDQPEVAVGQRATAAEPCEGIEDEVLQFAAHCVSARRSDHRQGTLALLDKLAERAAAGNCRFDIQHRG